MELNDYGVNRLKVAIVEKAVIDYIRALRNRERGTITKNTERDIVENEMFFMSEWFGDLTEINPYWLIRHCKEKAKKNEPIKSMSLIYQKQE